MTSGRPFTIRYLNEEGNIIIQSNILKRFNKEIKNFPLILAISYKDLNNIHISH
jgi:hypothetical protein